MLKKIFPLLISLLYIGAGIISCLTRDWRGAVYGFCAAALNGAVYL